MTTLLQSPTLLNPGVVDSQLAAYAPVYSPLQYGAKCDGTTDDTAAVNAMLTDIYNAGGGIIAFPSGKKCRCDGQIVFPNDGNASQPKGVSYHFTGPTAVWDGQWTDPNTAGAAVWDLRYTGGGANHPKINTHGTGVIEIEGMVLTDGGTSSNPWWLTTQTTILAHNNAFLGNAAKNQGTCDQDVFVLGGSTQAAYDNTDSSAFAGYGTVIRENFFSRIRRGVLGNIWTNSVVVESNTFSNTCGSGLTDGAAVEINTYSISGAFCRGNVIEDNLFEIGGYPCGVKLSGTGCDHNHILENGFWDAGGSYVADVYFDTNVGGNYYEIGISNNGTPYFEGSPGSNHIVDGPGGVLYNFTGKSTGPTAGVPSLAAKMASAGQTADLFQGLTSTGAKYWWFDAYGDFFITGGVQLGNGSTASGNYMFAAANLAGLPGAADGAWGFTADGHIYCHLAGAWTVKV